MFGYEETWRGYVGGGGNYSKCVGTLALVANTLIDLRESETRNLHANVLVPSSLPSVQLI